MPEAVTIYEVGPRDGLQNEPAVVPAEVKAELIRRLLAAGLTTVETTSFVRPDRVPQLADAEEVLDRLGPAAAGVRLPVLVPNARGLDRALERGVTSIAVFASATESFAQANLGRSVAESMEMFAPVVERARSAGRLGAGLRLDVLRRPLGGRRADRPGRRRRAPAGRPGRRPAQPRRHHRRRHRRACGGAAGCVAGQGNRRRADRRALPRHLRPGARQHAGRPAVRGPHRRRRRRRPGRLPVRARAPPATWPPRTWSGPWTAWASGPASISRRWSRRASGWPSGSAGPARRGWSRPSPASRSDRPDDS